jgi:transcriptional regulator with XRE-family HTH domain
VTAAPPPSQQPPPPEGDLIRRARDARGLSLADAAARVVETFGGRLSASRLSQIETGDQKKGGSAIEVRASDARLAHIAYIVGTSPDQLDRAGRPESAETLREILRQRAGDARPGSAPAPAKDDPLRQIMEDGRLPLETRRAMVALAEAMKRRRDDESA